MYIWLTILIIIAITLYLNLTRNTNKEENEKEKIYKNFYEKRSDTLMILNKDKYAKLIQFTDEINDKKMKDIAYEDVIQYFFTSTFITRDWLKEEENIKKIIKKYKKFYLID